MHDGGIFALKCLGGMVGVVDWLGVGMGML